MTNEHAIQTVPAPQMQLAVADLLSQHQLIQEAIRAVMIEGHHYGHIPGTEPRQGEKPRPPVLHKPGAEKLCSLFRLAPSFDVKTKDLPGGHREERVTCTLTHIGTGVVVATALGSCSTMEAKYRYRNAKPKCPACGADTINKSADEFYCWKKKGGCGATFPLSDKRISEQPIGLAENRDLADTFNTVLKMATKRAHIAATLLATAASDAFVVEEEAADDDEPEDRPRKGEKKAQQKRDDPPPTELTSKQRLIKACLERFEAMLKSGRTKQDIVDLLGTHGIAMPAKWNDLDEQQLEIVKKAFDAELKAGTEVPQ